jgi:secondary thiamine-phosphate synthase enzyme
MQIIKRSVSFETKGNMDIRDITEDVQDAVGRTKMADGIVSCFAPGATGCLTTIEYESGLLKDLRDLISRLIPQDKDYAHNLRWADGNGHSHLTASLIGPSITVPFSGGRLQLGTWQQIVFIDCDTRPRRRNIILHIIGR